MTRTFPSLQAPHRNGKEHGAHGTYSYGIKSETQLTIYEAPLNADGKVDYTKMDAQKYEQFFLPQYLAPYIPEANSWQKGQPHPKIQLTVEYHTGGDTSQGRTRTSCLMLVRRALPGCIPVLSIRTGITRYSLSCRNPLTGKLFTGSSPGTARQWISLRSNDVHENCHDKFKYL